MILVLHFESKSDCGSSYHFFTTMAVQPPLARPPGPPAQAPPPPAVPARPPNAPGPAPAPPLAPPVPAPAQPVPPAAGAGSNAIPWGPQGIVPPTTSLTAPAVGDRSGFVGGLIPNAPTAPFANPAPGSMAPSPQVPGGTRLVSNGPECVAFEVPQSMTGVQSAHVLGCIQVAAGQWACSADQLASPVSAPTC
ncbi:hypothetical protein BCR44DRAFT_90216 [Catenaria anguillulae PL171]|uniref:Uncharacterized protein n=1 Tax=Catenaria anguillulae PL171 TaxID=765915 RepID=A0A1Y2HEA0_9FUNG|nr:hypothetical protein BCR44DRAFT_90216 [Catenaria anguillulae PL171]